MLKKSVVLSLSGSDRREGFFQANWGDLDFRVFEAVDTRDGSVPPAFNYSEFVRRYGHDPRPGEMGCAVSHYLILKEFAEEPGSPDDLILVAEDDARPVPEFSQLLQRVISKQYVTDLLLLSEPIFGSQKNMKFYAMSLAAYRPGFGRRAGHFIDKVAGTGLYLMTRHASRLFIEATERAGGVSWVADDYRTHHTRVPMVNPFDGMDIQVVRPGLADWEGETTIQDPAGYEAFRQRKLAEHASDETPLVSLITKIRNRLNMGFFLQVKDLAVLSVKDFPRFCTRKWF